MSSTGKMTHVEINIRTKDRKLGKLWLDAKTIGWIPARHKEPIKKSWKEFADWMNSHLA